MVAVQAKAKHLSPSVEKDGDGEIVITLNCKIL